jgi:CheY-like chemotaxis protein
LTIEKTRPTIPSEETMPHVLVVDDDDELRDAVADALRDAGLSVKTARNGREALDVMAKEALPAVILLDLMMPIMSGWEFRVAQLRDEKIRAIPIVVMSAVTDVRGAAEQLQADGFLMKPVELQTLIATVTRFM